MKQILMIATGGTIASKPTKNGLAPQMTAAELLRMVPELSEICRIETVQLMNIDSTNMAPVQWLRIAACIRENYEKYDGFVIIHGTDTMAYTSAALSYLIQGSKKPIILTGSQKSIWLRDTDARTNLIDAFLAATDEMLPGVYLVFDGKVICGTRARKMRSKSMNAFASIDWPEAALIRERHMLYLRPLPVDLPEPVFSETLDPRIFVLRLIPGTDPAILTMLSDLYHALVIESFGVGGLPDDGNGGFLSGLTRWQEEGKPVVISTQVPHEGSDIGIYRVGRQVRDLPGVFEAHTMTPEATVTKLMWILGKTRDLTEVRSLFYTPVAMDLLPFQPLQPNYIIVR